jgi:hypothetical protein
MQLDSACWQQDFKICVSAKYQVTAFSYVPESPRGLEREADSLGRGLYIRTLHYWYTLLMLAINSQSSLKLELWEKVALKQRQKSCNASGQDLPVRGFGKMEFSIRTVVRIATFQVAHTLQRVS